MDIRFILAPQATTSSTSWNFISDFFPRWQLHNYYKINVADMRYICFYYLYSTIILVPKCWTKCPWVLNIKMSLMPKGINEIIYNPGVFISTPEYVLIPYP